MLGLVPDRLEQIDLFLAIEQMADLMRHAEHLVLFVAVQVGVGHAGDLHLRVVGEYRRDRTLVVVEKVLIAGLFQQRVQIVLQ